ncbi:hypothetical protein [Sulfitobacter sp. W074]|uniref:hypothetical protein n=1 Tax=Sulfitobacter sp. W074 TaxID=2867026 RepID=UPI0021A47103|nr:hypothetical protein [Sulfitobacter sp. W074]UWR37691.1 hypothetical protein K3762_01200 [Sulfitobacter sp. W074]
MDAIQQAAEALAADPVGRAIAEHCKSFEEYLICLTWNIYDALGELGPDTMVSEVQMGMAEAKGMCEVEYEASQPGA